MNPCPCGYMGDPKHTCKCSPMQIERYMGRISGPLLDRIDLHIEVPAVPYQELAARQDGTSSASMRTHVQQARDVQMRRFGGEGQRLNSRMTSKQLRQVLRARRRMPRPDANRDGVAGPVRASARPHLARGPHHRRPGSGARHQARAPERSDRLSQPGSQAVGAVTAPHHKINVGSEIQIAAGELPTLRFRLGHGLADRRRFSRDDFGQHEAAHQTEAQDAPEEFGRAPFVLAVFPGAPGSCRRWRRIRRSGSRSATASPPSGSADAPPRPCHTSAPLASPNDVRR